METCLRSWVVPRSSRSRAAPQQSYPYSYEALAKEAFAISRLSREWVAESVKRHMLAAGASAEDVRVASTGTGGSILGSAAGELAGALGWVPGAMGLGKGGDSAPASSATGGRRDGGGAAVGEDEDEDGGGLTLLGDDSEEEAEGGASSKSSSQAGSYAAASGAGSSSAADPGAALPGAEVSGRSVRSEGGARPAAGGDPMAPPLWYNPKVLGFPTVLLPIDSQRVAAAKGQPVSASATGSSAGSEGSSSLPSLWEAGLVATVAPSPPLSTLCSLLPAVASSFDWRCVYTSSRHAWSLSALQQHCEALAPILLVLRVRVKEDAVGASGAVPGGMHDDRTIGVFSSSGISPPRRGRPSRWKGHPQDALFQLAPEVAHYPAVPPGMGSSRDPDSSQGGISVEYDMVVHSTEKRLLIGGQRASPTAAITLDSALTRCSVSARWMRALMAAQRGEDQAIATAGVSAASSAQAEVLGIEAFAFVNRGGGLHTGRGPGDVEVAKTTSEFLATQERRDRDDVAERAEKAADMARSLASEDMRVAKELASKAPGSEAAAAAMDKARASAGRSDVLLERAKRAREIEKSCIG